MRYLLGIDIGTNGTKSVLFDEEGGFVDLAYRGYELLYPREGWVEQRAQDWWGALVETVRELLGRNPVSDRITALSLSAQGGATVLLDEDFIPLGNAVSWLDMRARETQGLLGERISEGELLHLGGWDRLYSCSFPVIFWFKERETELFERTRHFASTIDYVNQRLTGQFIIDYTNCALTEFLDIENRGWSESLLGIAGIDRDRVAEILPSGTPIGPLSAEASRELGLPPEVLVVSGGHDQYCANIGSGAVQHGDCVLSAGTAWALLATSDRLLWDASGRIHPGIHLLQDKYGLMTAVSWAGESINWYRSTFMEEYGIEALSDEVRRIEAGSGGLLFIPKFISSSLGASFLQVDTAHDRLHFARAVMEGVALANRWHIEAFRDIGMNIEKLIMIGGGTKSSVWPGIVADVSDVQVLIPEQRESACAGAALLAGVGAGIFESIHEASGKFVGEGDTIAPDRNNRTVYDEAYRIFESVLEHV
jgi:sugar (pentulose or hexulose) kinase